MTQLIATTTGLYPFPEWGKDRLAQLKGHQRHDLLDGSEESDELTNVYDELRSEVIDLQLEAGLDRIVEGQLRWDDILAYPLAVHDNVDIGGIVRYYDNNNFYREVAVVDELTPDGTVPRELSAAREQADEVQSVLPGPYSLADLAVDEYYGDAATFLDAVADFLASEVEASPDVETLYLLEPSLITDPEGADSPQVTEAIDTIAAQTDAEVVVQTFWDSPTEGVHGRLLDADVDAIGYDFVNSADRSLELISEYGTHSSIGLGLVDGRNTIIEQADDIRSAALSVPEETGRSVDTIYLSPNTELFYLPVNRFEAKLQSLARAAAANEVES